MAHAFIGVVVQIDVRDFHLARRQRIRIHAKAVILGRDFNVPGLQIFDGMVRAMVAEFQLVGAAAQGQPTQLVTQANAKDRTRPSSSRMFSTP